MIENVSIITPSPQAANVEHVLNQLQNLIARYRYPALTWMREQNLATVR